MGLSEDGASSVAVLMDRPYLAGGSGRLSGVYLPGAAAVEGVEQGCGATPVGPVRQPVAAASRGSRTSLGHARAFSGAEPDLLSCSQMRGYFELTSPTHP